MAIKRRLNWHSLILLLLLAACRQPAEAPEVRVVAEGLLNPLGLAALPDGGLLIAEEGTGERDNSAGVSLISASGDFGRLISGLPSSRDSGDLSGAPLVAVSPAADRLYVGHFGAGHLLTLPLDPAGSLALPETPMTAADLVPAMEPLRAVQLVNPFDLTFDAVGAPVVSDASANGVARETEEGATTFFHQFAEIPDPTNAALSIDPVPTGITRVGQEYYVTLTGGCPYPVGGGQLVAIDEARHERTLLTGLDMPIDIVAAPDGAIWLLEFARFEPGASCFSGEGYLPNTGRLSRLEADGSLAPVVVGLNYPGAVLPLADGTLYISEVFGGRVLHVDSGQDPERLPISAAAVVADAATLAMPVVPRATVTPAPAPTAQAEAKWHFQDVAAAAGLDFQHGVFQEEITADPAAMMGGGLCWLDYNNDGWLDLYLVNSHSKAEEETLAQQGNLPQNALYRNRMGTFLNVSAPTNSGLSLRGNGCVAADLNMDGFTDIYITADGPNALLWNNGDGTFSEGAAAAGVDAADWNSAAVVGDLNGDNWPDLFVASYIDLEKMIPNPSGAFPQDFLGLPDYLYLSQGPDPATGRITFANVAVAAGLDREERGLGALFTDLDLDGDLDLYVANDGHPNRLYQNEPWPGGIEGDPAGLGFRFSDLTDTAGAGDSGSGMGVAGGDYDGDGLFDLFITNFDTELNAIYHNETAGDEDINFRYSTYRIGIAGLGANMTGWGTALVDLDQDTDLDVLVANGRVPVSDPAADAELVRLYGNRTVEGFPGQFRDWTEQVGLEAVGPLLARGSATADYDNDGDLDVAINTIAGRATLLQNEGAAGNWLQVAIAGFYPGTLVTVTLPDGRRIMREWHAGSSYLASEDPRLHFGLGEASVVPEVVVRWPDGRTDTLTEVTANQVLHIEE